MKGISVIICCHNSGMRIEETLSYLKKQKTSPNLQWEVLLIDNNSEDDTVELALSYWGSESNAPLKIVAEKQRGQMYARRKGVLNASYDFIIFCDDDNRLQECYLDFVYEILSNDPKLGGVGGQSFPAFARGTEVPDWFRERCRSYAVGEQFEHPGYLPAGRTLWGAGLSVKREAISLVFDDDFPLLLSGRQGVSLMSGDDSEICLRIQIAGFKLKYDPRLVFTHFLPASRLTAEYYQRLQQGFRKSFKILGLYEEFISASIKNGSEKITLIGLTKKAIRRPNKSIFLKLLRFIYWVTGIPFYKSKEMGNIKNFYKAHYRRIR